MNSVLVVDDEPEIRSVMSRWARAEGYQVAEAEDADEALAQMARRATQVAVCDVRMPGRDGFWLADRFRERFPDTAVVMSTGILPFDAAVLSLRSGAVDYLRKPFSREQLTTALLRGTTWHRERLASRTWAGQLTREFERRQTRTADWLACAEKRSGDPLEVLLRLLQKRVPAVYQHSRRTAALALKIADALGLSSAECSIVRQGALLHDLGKTVIPSAVLNKPAALSSEEWPIMRRKTDAACRLIGNRVPQAVLDLVAAGGAPDDDQARTPDGLTSPATACSQILAVADAFDSMTHTQPYREAVSAAEALEELRRCSGSQFAPRVVDTLSRILLGRVPVTGTPEPTCVSAYRQGCQVRSIAGAEW
jgi:response regulator RpfG family c-di-GMP phosphodiesterase